MNLRNFAVVASLACSAVAWADEPGLEPGPPINAPALSRAVITLAKRGDELDPDALEQLLQLPGLARGLVVNQPPERGAARNRSMIFRPEMPALDISLVDLEWSSAMESGKTVWHSYLRLIVQRDACPTAAILSKASGKEVSKTETNIMLDDHWSLMTYFAFEVPTPNMHPASVMVNISGGCEILVSRTHD